MVSFLIKKCLKHCERSVSTLSKQATEGENRRCNILHLSIEKSAQAIAEAAQRVSLLLRQPFPLVANQA